jgi:hypothetical protein
MPVNFVVDRPFSRGFWRGKNTDGHKVKFRVPRLSRLNVLFYYEKGPCLCSMSRSFSLSLEGPAVLEDLQYGLGLKKLIDCFNQKYGLYTLAKPRAHYNNIHMRF